jgi:hypothetical protein
MSVLAPKTSRAHVQRWQRELLPLMSFMLVAAAIFFAVISVYELRDLYGRVEQRPFNEITATFANFEQAAPDMKRDLQYVSLKTLSLLEANALERRYQEANSTMLARVWTRQLGFITGMLLALVGAAFILGKLDEPPMQVDVQIGLGKGSLASSSPGLVLSALGAVLMAIALYVPFEVKTYDTPSYLLPAPAAAIATKANQPNQAPPNIAEIGRSTLSTRSAPERQ